MEKSKKILVVGAGNLGSSAQMAVSAGGMHSDRVRSAGVDMGSESGSVSADAWIEEAGHIAPEAFDQIRSAADMATSAALTMDQAAKALQPNSYKSSRAQLRAKKTYRLAKDHPLQGALKKPVKIAGRLMTAKDAFRKGYLKTKA